jgi:pimeloyl-ACP methyl ester carboxylesterase
MTRRGGFSDRPHVHCKADLYDRQLSDILTALHVQTPVELVALSMGGPIAVTFAARHPERVRALALLDPGYWNGGPMPCQIRTPVVGAYVACAKLVPSFPEGQNEDFLHPERCSDYFTNYRERMRYKGFRRAILWTVSDYFGVDVRPDFPPRGQTRQRRSL